MAGPDTKNIDPLPYAIPGNDQFASEPDTKELDALLDSLNGSAERFQTLWFSFLGLTLYLAIAALATTHRDLLLNNPQNLPILNIKVELLPFYVIAPLLYLVFHFYLLMMLALLAGTAAEFDKQLRTTLPDEADRERYRARVENALFLQLLVGMKGERSGANAFLLGLIARITIALAPLATLVLMQVMFLPYHHFRITWWHRALVITDLAIALIMWRRFFYDSGIEKPLLFFSDRPGLRSGLALAANLGAIYVVLWLSLGEGQWAGENQVWPANFAATEKGVVFGLFPDRLQLRDETIVGEKTLKETKEEIASRGGDFVPTIRLGGRDLQAAILSGADLRGVSLNSAAIQGADLSNTRLDGAHLKWANLQGADLKDAQLQGADLHNALLQGAELEDAQLQGADLTEANLQSTGLSGARLQAASLILAQLQGANLREALLQGAVLGFAQMQGADLSRAQLQGADLRFAQLQGADLRGADMSDTELDKTFVFGADISDANLATAAIRTIETDKVKRDDSGKTAPLSEADVDEWIAAATEFALEKDKAETIRRFARLKPVQPTEQDTSDQAKWTHLAKQSLSLDPDGAQYRRRLANRLGDLACDADGAPYVARGLVGNDLSSRLAALGDQLGGVRKRMKAVREKPDACEGVAGFTENDWRQLDAIAPVQDQNKSQATTPAP
jgi:uncharacterized protein YjbI with pentapeptide repeats